ncbi:MAG: excinuclease ABC subunit UvrA [Chlamydiae bacterium]|nr:excinuclease ABC subunit UvrA [Chlamydiota bacterium]
MIELKGVSVHNLKSISLKLKQGELIVFTGVSGSGKSSLAFDTIYTEGQRRYIDSLSAHAKRYLGNLPKPDATLLEGIPPTIAIEQKTSSHNPRSTVGTITAIYDYLRVLYARLGEPYCPISGEKVSPISKKEIERLILEQPEKTHLIFLAPLIRSSKGEHKELFVDLIKKGFLRVRVDKEFYYLSETIPALDKSSAHDIEVVIDRINLSDTSRVLEAIQTGLEVGKGLLFTFDPQTKEERLFSEYGYSKSSGMYYKPLEPEDFSFNHPKGMCSECAGLGYIQDFDLNLIIDKEKSIEEDCCLIAGSYNTVKWGNIYQNLASLYKFKLNTPWKNLSENSKKIFLYGTDEKWIKMIFTHPQTKAKWVDYVGWKGVIFEAKKRLSEATSELYLEKMHDLMHKSICHTCNGSRIKDYPRNVKFKGKQIFELANMPVRDSLAFFNKLQLTEKETIIGADLIQEIHGRLLFLHNVGLDYLTLSRDSPSLSGGESQRVRLASQIGFGLVKVAYILDEPSIGLHPRDNEMLIKTLIHLRDKGNTVIVVEHDEETIRSADTIVDIGPLAGINGGELIAIGNLEKIINEPKSITGAYLSGRDEIPITKKRKISKDQKISIFDATHNNLKKISVTIPLGVFTAITGVSGSGKSSLITDILHPALSNKLNHSKLPVGSVGKIEGIDQIDKVIAIDQSPIGRTPRSNPATYVKLFDDIRDLFAKLPQSQAFGYTAGHFSFNVKEGSCFACGGMGMTKIDMDFLEDEWVTCANCKGERFDKKTLSILYKEKNIYDILELTIDEASLFFSEIPSIYKKLALLKRVGLGYLKLGQSATTLSGGEAQRIKLAKELIRPPKGHTFYILDEPTTGLHFHDTKKLIEILQELVDAKNSVLVIEHNLDLIKTVDWIIELGPEGGGEGGYLIAENTPEKIIEAKTCTGIFLKKHLEKDFLTLASAKRQKELSEIKIKDAHQNNLKNLSLTVPHNSMCVFTGPSGSGKTSLAFETIYAEGQRRYIESLSTYAKRFVKKMPKAKVEEIEGLSPAIAIEHHAQNVNPRSTLGTLTEIYDYLRIIYSRMGTAYCPESNEEIKQITPERILKTLFTYPEGTKMQILAPITLSKNEEFSKVQESFQKSGYVRLRLNKVMYEMEQEIPYDKKLKNQLELVIDRLVLKKGSEKRFLDAIVQAASFGKNLVLVALDEKDLFFNLSFAVESTGKSYPSITHHTFSFNSLEGMCLDCEGLGFKWGAHLEKDKTIISHTLSDILFRLLKEFSTKESFKLFETYFKKCDIPINKPIKELKESEKATIFEGSKMVINNLKWIGLNNLFVQLAKTGTSLMKEEVAPFLVQTFCTNCDGTRLNKLARNVRIDEVSIGDLCRMPLDKALFFIETLRGEKVLKEALQIVKTRLSLLCNMGLHYLSIERGAPTLSGGEVQRTRLAKQLGLGLTGVLYVLDEPTIGLHPHNNHLLNNALKELQKLKNTLILVEHDPLTISKADYIYDFGKGSGNLGGTITAKGTVKEICQNKESLTGNYLSGKKQVPLPKKRRNPKEYFSIKSANKHNLQNVSLEIPKKVLTCVTGVSGSGKSTLLHDIIVPGLTQNLQKRVPANSFIFEGTTFENVKDFDRLISIDQGTHKTTSRSDLLTYTDLLTSLRTFYSLLPEAKAKGLLPRHFSYNHPSGMCKKCKGLGHENIELEFLAAARVVCDSCNGFRLNPLSLTISYKGKHFGKLFELTVSEAKQFLPDIPKIHKILDRLSLVGLDYLTLGQETQTLSTGEFGRLRLSRELAKTTKDHPIYIFDEPTSGLHFDDIAKIIPIFQSLVDKGSSVIIIEHNLDIIANADYIIDLGPDAGMFGGKIMASSTFDTFLEKNDSYTAKYLREYLKIG